VMYHVAVKQVDERIQRHYEFPTKRILLTRDPKDVSRRGQCDFSQLFWHYVKILLPVSPCCVASLCCIVAIIINWQSLKL